MERHGIKIKKRELVSFCKRNHIKKLSFFGSFTRDDFNSESDIDLLVEFERGKTPGFFDLVTMEEQLSGYFNGRRIDLRTASDLSRYFREKVVTTSEVLYVGS